jgi:predicted outer membrane protein
MTRKLGFALGALGALRFATGAHAQTSSDEMSRVLAHVHRFNDSQVELGKLAETNGSSEQVRSFGKKLVKDAQDADNSLIGCAQKNRLSVIQPGTGLLSPQQRTQRIDQLSNLRGSNFDRQLLSTVISDDQQAMRHLDPLRGSVSNQNLRSFIERTLLPAYCSQWQDAYRAYSQVFAQQRQQQPSQQQPSGSAIQEVPGPTGPAPVYQPGPAYQPGPTQSQFPGSGM